MCLLAGRDDLLFKFLHAWIGIELVVISQGGSKKPSRVLGDSSEKEQSQLTDESQKGRCSEQGKEG